MSRNNIKCFKKRLLSQVHCGKKKTFICEIGGDIEIGEVNGHKSVWILPKNIKIKLYNYWEDTIVMDERKFDVYHPDSIVKLYRANQINFNNKIWL